MRQHDWNSPVEGRSLQNQEFGQKLKLNPKEQDREHQVKDMYRNVKIFRKVKPLVNQSS